MPVQAEACLLAVSITAVTADGSLVFGKYNNLTSGRIFRWAAPSGPMVHLAGGWAFAGAIDDGAFVAANISVGSGSSGTVHAGRLVVGGQWQDLGVLAGHIYSESRAISADGAIVAGWSMNTQQVRRAFRWTAAGGMQDLGTLPGYPCSQADAISGDGSTIAGICEPVEYSNPQRAFRWTAAGGMQNLGLLPGCNTASVSSVNADGTIVTGYSTVQYFVGGGGPFVWTAQTGMIPLNTP